MQDSNLNQYRLFVKHIFFISIVFLILGLIRYPYLLNGDHFFTGDEGMLASTILDLMNGERFAFYYDFGNTFGLTFGLVSAPLIWLLGPTSTAYNLPAILFYSLYLWTTYLIAKTIIPRTAYIVLVLMIFAPSYITQLTIHNWPHVPAAFLGNCIFLLFIKLKISEKNNISVIFLLFFTMGLAIYTYTYSLIFILTIAILYALTHSQWDQIKGKLSFRFFIEIFKNKKSKRDVGVQLLDILIFIFFLVVCFSYIVGGFAFDIGGVSILQVKEFHNAAIQLVILILIRLLIRPKGSIAFIKNTRLYLFPDVQVEKKRMIFAGGIGFLVGLSPRIASVVIGETWRGGQGHDTDFLPTKLLVHLYSVFFKKGPELFDIDRAYQNLVSNPVNTYQVIFGILLLALVSILLISLCSFIFENKASLKNIMTLRSMEFEPVHLVLLAPIIVCLANTIVANGPETRYLFPLFGSFVLWICIFIDKAKIKFKYVSVTILMVWMSFNSISNYRTFQVEGLVKGVKLVKFEENYIYELIEFLEKKKISVAYSDYGVAGIATYLSGGKLNVSGYSNNPVAKTRKKRGMGSRNFAIIAQKEFVNTYNKYLSEKNIKFKVKELGLFKVYWDFSGDQTAINSLRSLILEN